MFAAIRVYAFQSRVDRMLRRKPRVETVIERGVAALQTLEPRANTVLEILDGSADQIRCSTFEFARPLVEINSGQIYIVLADSAVNSLDDCRARFRTQRWSGCFVFAHGISLLSSERLRR